MIQYQRTIKGASVSSITKAMTMTSPAQLASSVIYGQILQLFYTDLSTQLSLKIPVHIQQNGKVNFNIQKQSPIQILAPLFLSPLISKAQITAKLIDVSAKSQTSILSGKALDSSSVIIWTEFCKFAFIDLTTIFMTAIPTGLNSAMVITPIGVSAPPVVSSFAPAPAILTKPFLPIDLKPILEQNGFNPIFAKKIGNAVAGIKPQTSVSEQSLAGGMIYEKLLTELSSNIIATLEKSIKQYLITSGMNWSVPPGLPGSPVTPAGPMVTSPMPAPNMCN